MPRKEAKMHQTRHRTMSVSVRKSPSVLVGPSEPVSSMSSTVKLSSLDKGLDKIPVTALLMFEHPIHEPANTIKRALSQALVHYYPIAGRIVAGAEDNGELHIKCNGKGGGVAFVSASANCAFKEVMVLDRTNGARKQLVDELSVPCPSAKGFAPAEPLLLMQVTEFSCGAFVLGVTWNHAIADGAGMAQFLQAVGELAGGGLKSPSIVPIRLDESLPSPAPGKPQHKPLSSLLDPMDELSWLEITIPSGLIGRVKAEFSSRFAGQPCTRFEAASAVLWQCRTRAIMCKCSPETPAVFVFLADIRKIVGAKRGYYGNCITAQVVVAPSGAVANGGIVDIVKMIKDSKEKIGDQLFKKHEGSDDTQAVDPQQLRQIQYNMLLVSSWGNLGFDEVDFGSGRPARVTPCWVDKPSVPECKISLPWKAKDGVNVLSAMVKEEHVDAFLGELARLT